MEKKVQYYVPGKNHNRKKHYWWRYLCLFLLGQVALIAEIAVTLVGVSTSIDTKTLITMLGKDPNEVLTEDFQNDSLLTFVMKFASGETKVETVGDIREITPMIDQYYQTLEDTLSGFGLTLDKDEFYATNFSDLGTYFSSQLMNIELASTLGGFMDLSGLSMLDPILYKVPTANIHFSETYASAINLEVGGTKALAMNVIPSDASNKGITWESTDVNVASVAEDGTVTAVAAGDAQIKGTSKDNADLSRTVDIHVEEATPQNSSPANKSLALRDEPVTDGEGDNEHTEEQTQGEGGGEETPKCNHVDVTGDTSVVGEEGGDGICDLCNEKIKKARSLGEITSLNFGDLMGSLQIGTFLGGNKEDYEGFMNFLFDKTIGDLTADGFIDTIDLSLILGNVDSPLLKTIASLSIPELKTGKFVNDIRLGKLLGDDSTDKIMSLLKDCFLSNETPNKTPAKEFATKAEALAFDYTSLEVDDGFVKVTDDETLPSDAASKVNYYYFEVDRSGDTPTLKKFIDKASITDKINTAKVSDLMDIDADSMLASFADDEIMQLSQTFGNKYMYEIFGTRTYVDATHQPQSGEEILTDKDNREYFIDSSVSAIIKILCESKYKHTADSEPDYLTIGNMDTDLSKVLENATIGDLLNVDSSSDDLVGLFADTKLSSTAISDRIGTLQISDILKGDAAPSEGTVLYALKDCYIMDAPAGSNGKSIEDKMYELKLGEIMNAGDNNLLKQLENCYIYSSCKSVAATFATKADMEANTTDIGETGFVKVTSDESRNNAESYYAFTKTGGTYSFTHKDSLDDKINTLTLQQIIGFENENDVPKILWALRNSTLFGTNSIQNSINNLKFGDIIDSDGAPAIIQALCEDDTCTISNLTSKFSTLTFKDVFGDELYESDGTTLKGIWRYMLTNGGEDVSDSSYPLASGGMNSAMDNLKANMQTATIRQLVFDGLITISGVDPSTALDTTANTSLNKPLKIGILVANDGKLFGDYTLSDLMDFVASLASAS